MTLPEPSPVADHPDAGLSVVEPPDAGGPAESAAPVGDGTGPDSGDGTGPDSGDGTGPDSGDGTGPDSGDGTGPDSGDGTPGTDETTDPSGDAVDFRMALVSSVTLDLPSQHPAVVLRETEMPGRQLTFSIGMPDAVALSHAHRRIATPRPLTQELMSDVLQRFDIDVVAVRIVGRQGSLYFAELDLRGRTGRSVLSCRPSDALTVALHQPVPVPILIDVRLLETDGDVSPPGT